MNVTLYKSALWLTGLALVCAIGMIVMPVATAQQKDSSTTLDYQRAKYHPIHFKPAIDKATNDQCLTCHAEVLKPSIRQTSIAGVKASEAKAWYQETTSYKGEQDTFHRRHMTTDLAKQVMNMKCTTCHQGNDPRDEAPGTSSSNQRADLTLRKMVKPEICLKCHGTMDHQIMGLPAPWQTSKTTFQNNCLLCHSGIRTNRHQVNYLHASEIEKLGAQSGDSCFGCHGGRAWYRIPNPYARHPWTGMAVEIPDWAKNRPTSSEVRFLNEVLEKGVKP